MFNRKHVQEEKTVFWKRAGILVMGMLPLLLTGCTDAIPELEEEEMQMVEEYAAELLLEYHAGYQSSVLSEEEIEEEAQRLRQRAEILAQIEAQKALEEAENEDEAETGEEGEGGDGESEGEEVLSSDIDDFLEIPELEINFSNMIVCDSYPADAEANDWQGVTMATGNNRLVVFEFTLENVSGQDYELDMMSRDVRFVFEVGESRSKSALTTLLTNDFLLYHGVIPAGETITNVAMIELSAEDAENLNRVDLIIKYNGARTETTLVQNNEF